MDDVSDSFETLIAEQCDLAVVRRIEAGESPASVWTQLIDSGFVDALVPEDRGGAGLALRDVAGLVLACGRHALPLPLGQTMLVRSELAECAVTFPQGSITIADHVFSAQDSAMAAKRVPFGCTAEWVWVSTTDAEWLLPASAARRERSGGYGSLHADLEWSSMPNDGVRVERRENHERDWRAAGAAITALLLAGAMEKAVEMSIAYANERVQFGKPIGKLQAIQQQLSVVCEQMYAARSAALIGFSGTKNRIDRCRAATAKSRTSEAALTVANTTHAVHGAIGITAEYDLQMFTRRLHEWRCDYGSETYWNEVLGSALLDENTTPLEFVRGRIAPA